MSKFLSTFKKGALVALAILFAVTMFAPAVAPAVVAASTTRPTGDCSDNSIIRCGVYSTDELKTKINERDVRKIFAHYGIQESHFNNLVLGYAYKDGTVRVNDKIVARNTYSAGRQKISTTSKWNSEIGVYETTNQNAFNSERISAYVYMKDGQFQYAILRSCGNPLVEPKKPEEPKPAQALKCDMLTKKQLSETKYSFTVKYTAENGATRTHFTFDFGDGSSPVTTDKTTVEHTYDNPGTYTVKVSVRGTVDGKTVSVTAPACETKVTIPEEEEKPVQALRCDLLTGRNIGEKKYEFTTTYTAENGATRSDFVYDFGDGSDELVSEDATVEHTYAKPGTYKVKVTVRGTVDGKDVTDTRESCETEIVIPEPEVLGEGEAKPEPEQPVTLPVTGPAGIAGLFTVTTLAGTVAHNVFTRRRLF
jgi:hypothetical protein